MHDTTFLARYFGAFDRIPGRFMPEAYLTIAAYHQLLADDGVGGDVLEIGVHHGLSAIGLAALRAEGGRFVAVDLFDTPADQTVARSWSGDRTSFLRNMARFHDDLSFVTTIGAPLATAGRAQVGSGFSLCHIDAGHSAPEVYRDLELCAAVCMPGGLVVLDDYSSVAFPGVAEAALRFHLDAPGTLRPVAIGLNKAIFQREPAPFDLNARLFDTFPQFPCRQALLWNVSVPLVDASLGPYFDLAQSTPRRLVRAEGTIAARLEPLAIEVMAPAGVTVRVPVQVTNLSRMPLSGDSARVGLSYDLRTADHVLLKYDNERAYFAEPLPPGVSRLVDVTVQVPIEPGQYELEFYVVWEGMLWMKDHGNPTARVPLSAVARSPLTVPAAAHGAAV